MFINILILQQNKRQLNSLSLVIIILFSEFPQLLKLSLFLTLTFSPDLAVYLDKKENRVVRRLLCCGSPNWARTSDIMINSHALYRLSYGGISVYCILLSVLIYANSGIKYTNVGVFLFSRAVTSQVSSAYKGLTSVFGMRTGGTPQLNHRKGDWFL